MSGKIDWLYHRKNCVSCQRARDYLEANGLRVADQNDARTERRSPDEALALARTVDKVIVARGKRIVTFNMKNDPPDDKTLLAHLIGPSGNLRAPTVRKGRTLLVGFSEEMYEQTLGG